MRERVLAFLGRAATMRRSHIVILVRVVRQLLTSSSVGSIDHCAHSHPISRPSGLAEGSAASHVRGLVFMLHRLDHV